MTNFGWSPYISGHDKEGARICCTRTFVTVVVTKLIWKKTRVMKVVRSNYELTLVAIRLLRTGE